MNKIFLMLFFGICMISAVSAAPFLRIQVNGNSMNVSGWINYEGVGTYPAPIITNFNEVIGTCVATNFTNSTGNFTNSICTYNNYTRDVLLLSTNNNSVTVMTDTTSQAYLKCLDDKALYMNGMNACNLNLVKNDAYKDNYTMCYADKTICSNSLTSKDTELAACQKINTENSNQKYVYGAVGIIIGVLCTLGYFKLGMFQPKAATAEDNFNRQQSG